jgi:hypothetical protein
MLHRGENERYPKQKRQAKTPAPTLCVNGVKHDNQVAQALSPAGPFQRHQPCLRFPHNLDAGCIAMLPAHTM